MNDEFLDSYNRELTFAQQLVDEFAASRPKIARRLGLGQGTGADPNVARLIQSFAFLNAGTRSRLDDDFPQISEAVLESICPAYLAPAPSMAIVQFCVDPEQPPGSDGYTIRKNSVIESEAVDGVSCRFRTRSDLTLWPLELTVAQLSGPPFSDAVAGLSNAESVITLSLQSLSGVRFDELELDSLRFYIHGPLQDSLVLYKSIFNGLCEVVLSRGTDDREPAILGRECIKVVGFEKDQKMLPLADTHHLLTEFFTLPQKFLFFDVVGLNKYNLHNTGDTLQISLLLEGPPPKLEEPVSSQTFRLGCTPIVNLFQAKAVPIELTPHQREYSLTVNASDPFGAGVYTVDKVSATQPTGEPFDVPPFCSVKHAADQGSQRAYWRTSRYGSGDMPDGATPEAEIFLSVVNIESDLMNLPDVTLDIDVTCSNHNLPERLPFGNNRPQLQLADGGASSEVLCLTKPTSTKCLNGGRGWAWKFLSQLVPNHLSLTDNERGAATLREHLRLYSPSDSKALIDTIVNVSSRRVVGALPTEQAVSTYSRGVEVKVEFDEGNNSEGRVFLFMSILQRYLALYFSTNSFYKFIATTKQGEEVRRWPARNGHKFTI